MSTNAAIGMKQPDGSVRAVRLNWDGYVGYAGAILGGWYKTAEQVEVLLALGELSEIKEMPETCVAYHRDMGEAYRAPFTFETVDEYQYRGKGRLAAEYLYLFDDGKWSVYGLYGISEDGKSVFLTGIPASGSLLIRARDLPETKTVDLTQKWQCRTSENVMTLEKVTYRLGETGAWERETDTLSLFNRLLALPYDTPLQMRYAFEVSPELDAVKADLKIAVEPDENAAYFLNGKRIAQRFLPGYFLDRAIRMLKLPASAIKTGRNFFEVRTHFRQSAAVRAAVERAKKFESEANKLYFDSEIEAVYLLGKFGCFCKGSTKKEKSGSYYLGSPFVIGNMPDAVDSGKSVLQGFPFFTGTLVLEKEFTLSRSEAARFKRLRWSRFKANAAQITVNGREFPVIFAPPYELDVSSALKAGKNRIEFRLETSPRNTLGPFHTNETEPLSTSPGSFLTERDLLGWYSATDVPEYGVLEPSPEEITLS